MNATLKYLLDTGDIYNKRTLRFSINGVPVNYVTEYSMHGALGDFKWYITWKDLSCGIEKYYNGAAMYIHDAKARLYFPPFLDTRIPPDNREEPQRTQLMTKYGLKEYDKFDYIIATKGVSPIKPGTVEPWEPLDCPFDTIHAIEEIKDEYLRTLCDKEVKPMEVIRFKKEDLKYGCFSNFYPSIIEYEGILYNSLESAFQAAKTSNQEDRIKLSRMNPGHAKRYGRQVSLRSDWEEVKVDIMTELIRNKAFHNPEFCKALIDSKGAYIVEDTTGWHDNYWGDCQCGNCRLKFKHNVLGKCLMKVRDEIIEKYNL